MRQTGARLTLLILLAITSLLSSACLPTASLTGEAPLTVLGTLSTVPDTVVEARISLSRGKHLLETTVPVYLNQFEGTLQVPVGQWELTVMLVDADGIVRFQSKPQSTQVSYGTGTTVELVLQPADSTVHIVIDLTNYVFKQQALRARIHLDDMVHEVIRKDPGDPFETELKISPGSYEFKIELYTESFRASDRLGSGVWQVIHIGENEDLSLTWSPETQELQVAGRVETILPAPETVTVTGDDSQVMIAWDAVDHWNLLGYLVLAQTSPLERFELLTPNPTDDTQFLHSLDPESPPTEITYVIAAISKSGLAGYYSTPHVWRR
ncbi:MAG TPA: hypothetical protein GX014_04415 [Firmicutes bacterium]|jgi:hypothetical protein|nr:hypothetical protein [Bacillota bacterium]HHT42626.1 hypothetical protein [Bacillota bacterium]